LDQVTLGLWASVGIQKGKPFAPDAQTKQLLTEAAAVGDATVRALIYRWRSADGYYYPNSAWRLGFIGGYQFEEQGARMLDAYAGFSCSAPGTTPAREEKLLGKAPQYMGAFVDPKGTPFDGGKNSRLPLPPNIPLKDFWSVVVYSGQTRSML